MANFFNLTIKVLVAVVSVAVTLLRLLREIREEMDATNVQYGH